MASSRAPAPRLRLGGHCTARGMRMQCRAQDILRNLLQSGVRRRVAVGRPAQRPWDAVRFAVRPSIPATRSCGDHPRSGARLARCACDMSASRIISRWTTASWNSISVRRPGEPARRRAHSKDGGMFSGILSKQESLRRHKSDKEDQETMTTHLNPRPVRDSQSEMAEIVLPNDANPLGACSADA